MRILITSLLLLCPMLSWAKRQPKSNDTARINKIIRSIQSVIGQNRDSALALNRQAYNESVKLGYEQGVADAGWLLGTHEMRQSHYEQAAKFYRQSIAYYKKADDLRKLADMYALLGINEGMQQNSAKALGWFLQALNIARELKDEQLVADINYKIGLIYGQVSDYENAVHYSNLSLDYAKKTGDTNMQMIVYNNLGIHYGKLEDYDKALDALVHVRNLSAGAKEPVVEPEYFHNLGIVYLKTGRLDSARFYLDKALALFKSGAFPMGVASVSGTIGELLVKQERYAMARDYISISMGLAGEFDDKDLLYQNHIQLQKLYIGEGKYKEAALLSDTLRSLQELVENADKRAGVERAAMAMEMQRISDDIENLKVEEQSRTWQRNLFIGLTALTLFFILFALLALREIRKRNKLLQEQKAALELSNKQQNKIFAVISHDLRSPLSSIIGSLELLSSGYLDQQDQARLLGELHLSASASLETLDSLLHWGSGQVKSMEVRTEAVDIRAVAAKTKSLLGSVAARKSLRLVELVDDVCIARFDKNQLEFIMRNLVANAIKFSHEGQHIEVRGQKKNGRIILQVQDFGTGMSEEVRSKLFDPHELISAQGTAGEKGVGLGLILTREFLEKNNGHIHVTSSQGKGSCFELDIPAA